MRVYYCAAKQGLILRSPPEAGVSKDSRRALFSHMRLPYARGEGTQVDPGRRVSPKASSRAFVALQKRELNLSDYDSDTAHSGGCHICDCSAL